MNKLKDEFYKDMIEDLKSRNIKIILTSVPVLIIFAIFSGMFAWQLQKWHDRVLANEPKLYTITQEQKDQYDKLLCDKFISCQKH